MTKIDDINNDIDQLKLDSWQNDQVGIFTLSEMALPEGSEMIPRTEVAKFVHSIRRLRTLLGYAKQELYRNPAVCQYLFRLIVINYATLHRLDIPGVDQQVFDFDLEIQKVIDELDLQYPDFALKPEDEVGDEFNFLPGARIVFADLFDSHLFPTTPGETLSYMGLALDGLERTFVRGETLPDGGELEHLDNGGVMIWTLTQGIMFGFGKYVEVTHRMLQAGKSLDEVMEFVNSRIGFAAIGFHRPTPPASPSIDKTPAPNTKANWREANTFVSPQIIDKIRRSGEDIVIPIERPQIHVHDEFVMGGGTVRAIIVEIIMQLNKGEGSSLTDIFKRIKIVEANNTTLEYVDDGNPDVFIWKSPTHHAEFRIFKTELGLP